MRRLSRIALPALALALLGYVLPAERVLDQLGRQHRKAKAVAITLGLEGIRADWPREIRLELHPAHGLRIRDSDDQRWLVRRGRVVAGSRPRLPVWVPELEILSLQEPDAILAWLEALGVDPSRSRLARCGEADCFVIGTAPGELWLDKDRFLVVRLVLRDGRRVEFSGYRSWSSSGKFPNEINILDGHGPLAKLTIVRVEPIHLGPEDFSHRWVGSGRPN